MENINTLDLNFLQDYEKYLKYIKNYSNNYIKNSICTCRQFIYFLKQKRKLKNFTLDNLRQISKEDIYQFIYFFCENKNMKLSSIYTKINQLRSFFKYLCFLNHYYMFINPFDNFKTFNLNSYNKKLPQVLTLQECKKLLLKENYDFTKEIDLRDYTLLTFFLNTGVRVSEATNLRIEDVDLKERKAIIFGKGGKERIIYLNNAAFSSLEKYLKFKENLNKESYFVFTSSKTSNLTSTLSSNKFTLTSSLTPRQIERILKKRLEIAKITKENVTVHTLRHTFATLTYKETKDILSVKNILGHVSIDTTKIYTKLYNEDIKNTMDKNPLCDFKIN